jgi:serine phosphatase RsbU (regulator of sigma subunit)
VYQNGYSAPNVILRRLHKGIQTSLRQQQNDSKDGMDIVLITLTKDANNNSFSSLEYSGAMNPLYYTQLNKTTQELNLHEIKADKMPIGGMMGEAETTFTKHTIDLVDSTIETTLYLCSDGYQDQFGGEKGKKFMVKRLRELLAATALKPISEQEQILANTFMDWKGEQEQVDDVMILGIRV